MLLSVAAAKYQLPKFDSLAQKTNFVSGLQKWHFLPFLLSFLMLLLLFPRCFFFLFSELLLGFFRWEMFPRKCQGSWISLKGSDWWVAEQYFLLVSQACFTNSCSFGYGSKDLHLLHKSVEKDKTDGAASGTSDADPHCGGAGVDGLFPVIFLSCRKPLFQSEVKCKPLIWTWIFIRMHIKRVHFHKKDFALSFVLIVRVFGTLHCPIG